MQELLLIISLALILDLLWGEPPSQLHPVVSMGRCIDFLKKPLQKHQNKFSGLILTFLLLALFALPTYFILEISRLNLLIYILVSGLILFTTFSINALLSSVRIVKKDLNENINIARRSVSYLVSRDTTNLSEEHLVSASIESLTENVTDSVVSPLFYTFILGVPGAVAFRVINTLDAMVGYKDEKNIEIGWFPARLDDLANFIPARITGVLMVISAAFMGLNWRRSYHTMVNEANKTPSPNSGYPMAAAAGALGVRLTKKSSYQLGENKKQLVPECIDQALLLSQVTIILFLIVCFVLFSLTMTIVSFCS